MKYDSNSMRSSVRALISCFGIPNGSMRDNYLYRCRINPKYARLCFSDVQFGMRSFEKSDKSIFAEIAEESHLIATILYLKGHLGHMLVVK